MKVRKRPPMVLTAPPVADDRPRARYNRPMNRRAILVLVTTLLQPFAAGCGTSDDDTTPAPPVNSPTPPAAAMDPPADSPAPPAAGINEYCKLALFYNQELEKLRSRYGEAHPEVVMARELAETAEARCAGSVVENSPSGQWVERDGQIVCDGYLTRFDNQDYCAAEVPADWRPFTFDGELYYIQPLGSVEQGISPRSTPREMKKAP